MLRRLILVLCFGLLAGERGAVCAADGAGLASTVSLVERRKLEKEVRLVFDILQNHHYSGKALRELGNQALIAHFVDELDPERRFLREEDTTFLNRRFGRSLKSVYLLKGDFQPAFEIYDLFAERLTQRLDWVETRLLGGFEFESESQFDTDAPRPRTAAEQDRLWEAALKQHVLSELLAGRTLAEAKATVAESYREVRRRFQAYGAREVRNHFLDSIIRSFDPHSGYLSSEDAREFSQAMGTAMAGVGLELGKVSGRVIVRHVTPGGPADRADALSAGDELVGYEDESGQRIDFAGRSLREVVASLSGETGTTLRLIVRRPEGPGETRVELVRSRVIDPAQRARGGVAEIPIASRSPVAVGWIELPSFYGDGTEAGDSASRDVAALLQTMLEQPVAAVVLDLRRNPGGALQEAVQLAGLFLPAGARLMFASSSGGQPQEYRTADGLLRYEGPLVVLTSASSASASEILAGALRYHQRAVVVGAAATFGKGTVQSVLDLAQATSDPDAADWGALRLTRQHYFLPDGSPVQQRGVTADLDLFGQSLPGRDREVDLPGSLPPVPLTGAIPPELPRASLVTGPLLASLNAHLERHVASLPEWSWWQEERAMAEARHRQTRWSLHLATRRAAQTEADAQRWTHHERRLHLADSAAYPQRNVEVPDVAASLAAHREKLARRLGPAGASDDIRVGDRWFAVGKIDGAWTEVPLHTVEFRRYLPMVERLAATVTTSGKATPSAAALRLAFHEAHARQAKDRFDLLAPFQAALTAPEPAQTMDALQAFFHALKTTDPELVSERSHLDVPLREALRLAACWATDESP